MKPSEDKNALAVRRLDSTNIDLLGDFSERFGFTKVQIKLGPKEAWTVDGVNAEPFGRGAIKIAQAAYAQIIDPRNVFIGDESHNNPHYILDSSGIPTFMWLSKVGVYIGRRGDFRYKAITEPISINSYIQERVIGLKMKKDTPANTMVAASRGSVKLWNAGAKKPGDPVWWFIKTQSSDSGIEEDVGVAVNLSDPFWGVDYLQKELAHFRKSVTRRFDTAVARRVIASLLPESMVPCQKPIIRKSDYGWVVDEAVFEVDCPTKGGFLLDVLTQIARSIKEDNPELRAQAYDLFSKNAGFAPRSFDMPTNPINAEAEWNDASVDEVSEISSASTIVEEPIKEPVKPKEEKVAVAPKKTEPEPTPLFKAPAPAPTKAPTPAPAPAPTKAPTPAPAPAPTPTLPASIEPPPSAGKVKDYQEYLKRTLPALTEKQLAQLEVEVGGDIPKDGTLTQIDLTKAIRYIRANFLNMPAPTPEDPVKVKAMVEALREKIESLLVENTTIVDAACNRLGYTEDSEIADVTDEHIMIIAKELKISV